MSTLTAHYSSCEFGQTLYLFEIAALSNLLNEYSPYEMVP